MITFITHMRVPAENAGESVPGVTARLARLASVAAVAPPNRPISAKPAVLLSPAMIMSPLEATCMALKLCSCGPTRSSGCTASMADAAR